MKSRPGLPQPSAEIGERLGISGSNNFPLLVGAVHAPLPISLARAWRGIIRVRTLSQQPGQYRYYTS